MLFILFGQYCVSTGFYSALESQLDFALYLKNSMYVEISHRERGIFFD